LRSSGQRSAARHQSKSRDYLQRIKRWIDVYTNYPDQNAEAVAATWVDAPRALTADLRVRHDAGIAV